MISKHIIREIVVLKIYGILIIFFINQWNPLWETILLEHVEKIISESDKIIINKLLHITARTQILNC